MEETAIETKKEEPKRESWNEPVGATSGGLCAPHNVPTEDSGERDFTVCLSLEYIQTKVKTQRNGGGGIRT